jgi:antitoxin (DNA-binding transcriptional repressor) of toxin-antitoxin stability system
MLTETVDVQDIKTRLAELLSLVQQGTEVILEQDDVPLARIVPITSSAKPRVAGLHRGAIWISDDFDDPLTSEITASTATQS